VAALSIAGFDPSGGAGVLLDVSIFRARGLHGAAVLTAVTSQDSRGVEAVWPLPPEWIERQARSVLSDLPVRAIKIGMLGGAAQVETVVRILEDEAGDIPVVLDPVVRPKQGVPLLDGAGIEAMRSHLIRRAHVVTPNLSEAECLTGCRITSRDALVEAAKQLLDLGPRSVLLKGFREGNDMVDLFARADSIEWREHRRRRLETSDPHGTGCALSSLVAASLASGAALERAVEEGCAEIHRLIATGEQIGHGAPFLRALEMHP
jgi:hydroxymethylpyrimidine/phosphomethylpyrimidine kinase